MRLLTPRTGLPHLRLPAHLPRTLVVFVATVLAGLCCVASAGADATYVGQFGSAGTGDGQFTSPSGAAFDPVNHRVYVGDPGANRIGRIEEFDSAGTFVATVTPPISPGALAVDGSNGDLWVTDSGQIARLRSDGTLINQFSAVNGFPREIAVDSGQHAVWVRTAQFTIKEYSSAGALLRTVGGVDSTGRPTLFGNVSGLGVDPATGQLYIADIAGGNVPHPDGGSKRVLVFDSTGQFIRKFDTLNDNGNFSPTALSISPATGTTCSSPAATRPSMCSARAAHFSTGSFLIGRRPLSQTTRACREPWRWRRAGTSTYRSI